MGAVLAVVVFGAGLVVLVGAFGVATAGVEGELAWWAADIEERTALLEE